MRAKLLQLSAGVAFLCAMPSAGATPYVIDGDYDDWQINSTDLRSATAREQIIEDQHGNYLSPGYGGQTYDAEAIYLDWDANYLYVGVLTGLPKANPHNPAANTYGPGDIILDFNHANDSLPEYALRVTTRNGLIAGHLYEPGTWEYGIWAAPNVLATTQNPSPDVVGIGTGTDVATGELAYSTTGKKNLGAWSNDKHYFIEARIPTSAFGNLWGDLGPKSALEVHWAALCGNDIIAVDPAPVSEPATGALLGVSLGMFGWLRRRRSEQA